MFIYCALTALQLKAQFLAKVISAQALLLALT